VTTSDLPLLDSYLKPIQTMWPRLVVGALIGAAVATAVFFALPQRFVSTSSVALAPQVTFVAQSTDDTRPAFVTLDTIAYLVRSDAVVSSIARSMGVSNDDARRSTTVSAQPLSDVLRIHVLARTPSVARAGSQAAAKALLNEQKQVLALSTDRIRLLRKRISVLRAQAIGRSDAGTDPSALLDGINVLQQRLAEAVASNRPGNLVIRHDVMRVRSGQIEVFATAGLAVGVLLAGVGGAPRRSPRQRGDARASRRSGKLIRDDCSTGSPTKQGKRIT
jgi:hypothetical protein